MGENDTRLWRILHYYADSAPADCSEARQFRMIENATGGTTTSRSSWIWSAPRLLFATEGKGSKRSPVSRDNRIAMTDYDPFSIRSVQEEFHRH